VIRVAILVARARERREGAGVAGAQQALLRSRRPVPLLPPRLRRKLVERELVRGVTGGGGAEGRAGEAARRKFKHAGRMAVAAVEAAAAIATAAAAAAAADGGSASCGPSRSASRGSWYAWTRPRVGRALGAAASSGAVTTRSKSSGLLVERAALAWPKLPSR